MDAISRDGAFSAEGLVRVDANSSEIAKYCAAHGDLLFNTRNTRELVGKSAVFRGEPRLYNNNILRLRFSQSVLSEYVHGFLWSSEGQRQLEARKSGTTSVFAIYAKDLYSVVLPVPPLDIQREFALTLGALRLQEERAARSANLIHTMSNVLRARAFPADR